MALPTARRSTLSGNPRLAAHKTPTPSPSAASRPHVQPQDEAPRPQVQPQDEDALPSETGRLARKFTKLQGALGEVEVIADDIAQDLRTLGLPVTPVRRPRQAAPRKAAAQRKRPRQSTDPEWLKTVRVARVSFGKDEKRRVLVSFDGAKVALPRSPADILAVLLDIADCDRDGFPVPRTIDELTAAYSARRGHRVKAHTVVVAIGRLRAELANVGMPAQLIETVSGRGVRLRILRREP